MSAIKMIKMLAYNNVYDFGKISILLVREADLYQKLKP